MTINSGLKAWKAKSGIRGKGGEPLYTKKGLQAPVDTIKQEMKREIR